MEPWTKISALACLAVFFASVLAARLAMRSQQRAWSAHQARLVCPPQVAAPRIDFAQLQRLPAPVIKYFKRVLSPGQPPIRVARMVQEGLLRTDVLAKRWMAFEASHLVSPAATGFAWDARVSLAPLPHLRIHDAYVAGKGSGKVILASMFPVSSAGGNLEMNSGALHRYLAEAVWYPTALLPSDKLHWTAIDDNSALATLTDHGITVSLEFRFNAEGEVTAIYTPSRWGTFDGGYRQRPWEGHFGNYVTQDGMWVPSEGEVGWYADGTWLPVWKGKIIQVRYELAQ